MSKLICGDCKEVFSRDEADTYSENVGEFWGSPSYMDFYKCPCCGCEDVYDYSEEEE